MTSSETSTAGPAAGGTNWKNVGNWHWVEKACLPWAKTYISTKLAPVIVKSDEDWTTTGPFSVSVLSVGVTGDCDLNQRKGKVITIYDLEIKVKFKVNPTVGGAPGAPVVSEQEGTLELKDFMHDASVEDLEVSLTMSNTAAGIPANSSALISRLKKVLPAEYFARLSAFSQDLIDSHKSDVYIAPEDMRGHPTTQQYTPAPPPMATPVSVAGPSSGPPSSASVKGGVVTITQTVEFVASASDLFACFTDPGRIAAWTHGRPPSTGPLVPGSPYSFFDGNISGEIVGATSPTQLTMTWRKKGWPASHHSNVQLDFVQGPDFTTISLTHSQVPVGEKDSTSQNWHQYFWNPIKSTFGYGAHF